MPNWGEVLNEINGLRVQAAAHANQAVDLVRKRYLKNFYKKTGRNVIAYYSGWLSKPQISEADIIDEDKNGFMMAVHQLPRGRGLDLFLHTPGGSIAATQSIVDYLRKMFGTDIRAIVPQMAMSAGTMIACSCEEILMAKHSNLGPIDPQLRRLAAYGVIQEFKRALKEIKDDAAYVPLWQPILSQYRPGFLSDCENAIKWSNDFVRRQLETVMFRNDPKKREKANRVVSSLTNFRKNASHDRHFHYEECLKMGLNVKLIEEKPFDDEFQDLVLTVHHCYMHALMNTPTFKMIENHQGVTYAKQQLVMQVPVMQQQMPPGPSSDNLSP